ncbi:MAG: ASCH domain-containing protein [Gammaproteobacteria bacterium]|nr:ASCH domain-containing protein [Gammaproteobacteria bacterium]
MTYLPDGCGRPNIAELDAFWQQARSALGGADPDRSYQVRWIGLDDASTEQVIELISVRDKKGTFTLPWIVERTGQPNPAVGDTIILVDFDGHPRQLVRLTHIEEVAFGAITAAHTAIDGTPVRDLEDWIPLHTVYWNAMLEPHGLEVTQDMPVLVEGFELLYDPSAVTPDREH